METTPPVDCRHGARCHAQLARLLAAAGRHSKAVEHYERALDALVAASDDALERQLRVGRVETRRRLARSLAALKRRRDAVRTYEALLQDAPEDADAHVNLAALLLMRTDEESLRAAEQHCAEAIARCPALPEAHFNMNVVLRRLGRQQEAIELYWRYLERDHGVQRPRPGHSNRSSNQDSHIAREPKTSGDVAVLCVKWGVKYGPEYVNKLYRSLMRQCSRAGEAQLDMVCLTDDDTGIDRQENLHCLRLENGWSGWWNKCQVFAPQVSTRLRALGIRRCVYLDLDTVIVGDVSELLHFSGGDGLAILKTDDMANEQRSGGFNSSIMTWSSDGALQLAATVYELLKEHFDAITGFIYKFDHWLEVSHFYGGCLSNCIPHLHAVGCPSIFASDGGTSGFFPSGHSAGTHCRVLQSTGAEGRGPSVASRFADRVLPSSTKAPRGDRILG